MNSVLDTFLEMLLAGFAIGFALFGKRQEN